MDESREFGQYDQEKRNPGFEDMQAYEADQEAKVPDPALKSEFHSPSTSDFASTQKRVDVSVAHDSFGWGTTPPLDGTRDHHPIAENLEPPPGFPRADKKQLRLNLDRFERILPEASSQGAIRQDIESKVAAPSTMPPSTVGDESVSASSRSFAKKIAGVSTWEDIENLFVQNGPGPTLYDGTHKNPSELASSIPNTTLEQVYMESQQQMANASKLSGAGER